MDAAPAPTGSAIVLRLRPHLRALMAAVLDGPARATSALRRASAEGRPEEPAVAAYVDKVRGHSYRVESSDLDALRAAGVDDDGIFEITVAAALGEGLRRLRVGLGAIGLEP